MKSLPLTMPLLSSEEEDSGRQEELSNSRGFARFAASTRASAAAVTKVFYLLPFGNCSPVSSDCWPHIDRRRCCSHCFKPWFRSANISAFRNGNRSLCSIFALTVVAFLLDILPSFVVRGTYECTLSLGWVPMFGGVIGLLRRKKARRKKRSCRLIASPPPHGRRRR